MLDDTINIVLTCDDKYVQHAAVTIVSVVKNTKRKVHFYVFDCGILPENLERLKRLDVGANVLEVVQVQKIEAFENREYHNGYSPAIMYRFAIPEILSNLDKALYLDSDIIAVRDIGLLYDIDLGDKLLAGEYEERSERLCRRLWEPDVVLKTVYMASVVLLMNLKKMRELCFLERIVKETMELPAGIYGNQDIFNFVIRQEQFMILSATFYLHKYLYQEQSYRSGYVVLHLDSKPWLIPPVVLRILPGFLFSISYKYYEYLEETPFRECRFCYVSLRYALCISMAYYAIGVGCALANLSRVSLQSFFYKYGSS